jgi:hypothetical protein
MIKININSFLLGMGSIFNLAGNYYPQINTQESLDEINKKALASDWEMVSKDFNSILNFEQVIE